MDHHALEAELNEQSPILERDCSRYDGPSIPDEENEETGGNVTEIEKSHYETEFWKMIFKNSIGAVTGLIVAIGTLAWSFTRDVATQDDLHELEVKVLDHVGQDKQRTKEVLEDAKEARRRLSDALGKMEASTIRLAASMEQLKSEVSDLRSDLRKRPMPMMDDP